MGIRMGTSLLKEYDARSLPRAFPAARLRPRKLGFPDVIGKDVYNVTIPFHLAGETLLAGRVEPRENHESVVLLFYDRAGAWHAHPLWKPIPLEDPFFFTVKDIPYLGGVETFPGPEPGSLGWKTVFFDIRDLSAPVRVFAGPVGMKDIRLIELSDGRLGVFTRPQGGAAGLGTVGYVEVPSLEELTHEAIRDAKLISAPAPGSWEGVNQPTVLDGDTIGLIGHVAWMEPGGIRHYRAAACAFNRKKLVKESWRIIAERSDIPPGPAKRPDLVDVLFPGGLSMGDEGKTDLYVGASDAEAWVLSTPYPF